MISATQVVNLALSQEGDRYVFGKEVAKGTANPDAFDCSELIEWLGGRLGVIPTIPDGSWIQVQHCRKHGTLRPVSYASVTKGALLFRFVGDPFGPNRPSQAHVAISQGNGWTIEARSTQYGVGQFPIAGRGWTHGALIPGVQYLPEIPIADDPGKASPWAETAWNKALARDLIHGSHPQGAVTTEQVFVWLDRLGLLN